MEPRDQSEFNDAINKLQRMNLYFHSCAIAKLEKNADAWSQNLASLFSELITSMKKEEPKQVAELNNIIDDVMLFYEKSQGSAQALPRRLYWRLFKFELFIRQVYKDAGYEGKTKDYAGAVLR